MVRKLLTVPVALTLSLAVVAAACGSGATTAPATSGNGTPAGSSGSSAAPGGSPTAPGGSSAAPGATPTATPFQAAAGAVTLVAYSTPKAAYDAITPLWQATPDGSGVEVESSYGASGDQSRAVEAGLPADIVAFSLAPDIDRLVKAGLVASDWNSGPTKGMVTDSVVVLVVRKGNPKGIKTWDDVIKDGVAVIEPNPFTSGGARWNVMAAYGAWIKNGATEAQAVANLTALFKNIVVQDISARAALQTFIAGQGDVMLAYENEAIAAQASGQADIDYIVPDQTILIENPAAVATGGDATEKAKSFLAFLTTPEAQNTYAAKGYRPVIADVLAQHADTFPQPSGLFTIEDLGGWTQVTTKFFDKTNGIVAGIEIGLGVTP
ncbi:MAG: sulfate/thiosulfate transport system substrate-binding protein [Thermoleophilaceae bacterium]|nr:sulfate/thiosulfate transport system substrate-binding protein [Thermoleophilaceae bacterium]